MNKRLKDLETCLRKSGEQRKSFFSRRLWKRFCQTSPIICPGTSSDICIEKTDPNPILDPRCPTSIPGSNTASALCKSVGISLEVHPSCCTPLWRGNSHNCQDAERTVGKWYLLVTDHHGSCAEIAFYINNDSDFMLIGNDLLHKSNQLGS